MNLEAKPADNPCEPISGEDYAFRLALGNGRVYVDFDNDLLIYRIDGTPLGKATPIPEDTDIAGPFVVDDELWYLQREPLTLHRFAVP